MSVTTTQISKQIKIMAFP